jgi:hypothetical protein
MIGEEAKPTTSVTEAGSVPAGLEKFAGADGKLDVAKLSASYLETEHMAHEANQKRADAERSYAVLAEQLGGAARAAAAEGGAAGRGGYREDEPIAESKPLTMADAQPIVQGFIELIHPEIAFDPAINAYKDPAFINGLKGYVQALPASVKQAIAGGDFATQDWAIKQCKAIRGGAAKPASSVVAAPSGEKPNFMEGATPGNGDGKKQWTKEEIRSLASQNPKEYARLADTEIAEAYEEGRVK